MSGQRRDRRRGGGEVMMRDADLELMEYQTTAWAAAQAEAAGICVHGSVVGFSGKVFYPEQEGLRVGEVRCRDCREVFSSEQDWEDAMMDAWGEFR